MNYPYGWKLPAIGVGVIALVVGGTALLVAPKRAPIDDIRPAKPIVYKAETGDRVSYPAGNRPLLPLVNGQSREIDSVLNVPDKMTFGDFVWNDDGVEKAPAWVRIDLAKQVISVFRGGHEIGSAVILYGTDGMATPTGEFHVRGKDADYHSRSYDAPMPFSLWLTDDGVAIHGSNVRQGFATHGCIGVPNEFARRLFAEVNKGDPVWVLPPDNERAKN